VKAALVVIGLLLLSAASALQKEESRPKGLIHGIAVDQDRQPASRSV
jgi:hypothetical protein